MENDQKEYSFTPDKDGIFRGEPAIGMLDFLLEEIEGGMSMYQVLRDKRWLVKGYFHDKCGKWVAFDNRSFQCNVEEFIEESMAHDWVCGKFDVV